MFLIASPSFAAPKVVPGEYLVKFRPQSQLQALTSLSQSQMMQALSVESVNKNALTGAELVTTIQGKTLNDQYAKELLAKGIVDYIEPNYIVSIDANPNDSRFSELWGLHNTAQTGGTNNVDIDAPQAWNITKGSNSIVVGIVDTGVNYNHPDLTNNIWVNPGEIAGNGIDDDHNGVIDDIHGYNALNNSGNPLDDHSHGSHCAGTIGGVGNNNSGVAGVNWNVKIMALKFLSSSGSGTTADAIKAIEYAVRMKNKGVNLRVLNNSWGGGSYSAALEDAITLAQNAGILFVAAAGNAGLDNDAIPNYPSNYPNPNVISVAAVDHDGNLATFSNYGSSSVDLAAPGVDILSTVLSNQYASYSGTSMATPHVSGVAALVWGREPALTVTQLKDRLINTIKPLSTLNNLMASPGIVNAYNALTSSIAPRPPTQAMIRYSKKGTSFNYDSSFGTRVLNADDGYVGVNLGFSFPFYRENFRRIAISSNGRIVFLTANEAVPTTPDYANRINSGISPFHDDLYPPSPELAAGQGGIWFKTTSQSATITWVMINYAKRFTTSPQALLKFQLKIFKSGAIQMHYLDTYVGDADYDYGASASVGIAPPSGVAGEKLEVLHNLSVPSSVGNNKALDLRIATQSVRNDFDGDGKSDMIVFQPSRGMWHIRTSSSKFAKSGDKKYQLGLPLDIPRVGDYDGDGKADLSVWRPKSGIWYFRKSSTSYQQITAIQWGLPGDQPIVGDFDGDRRSDIVVYRPSKATFYALISSGNFNRTKALQGKSEAVRTVSLGTTHARPLVGNFLSDGADDFMTVLSPYQYWMAKDQNGSSASFSAWGTEGDRALSCDWDNDGRSDRVVVRTNQNHTLDWYIATADHRVYTFNFGSMGDIPSCDRDYNGDSKSDLAVFRPSTASWYFYYSSWAQADPKNKVLHRSFGRPGDIVL